MAIIALAILRLKDSLRRLPTITATLRGVLMVLLSRRRTTAHSAVGSPGFSGIEGAHRACDAKPLAMPWVCQGWPTRGQRRQRVFRCESIPPRIINPH